MIITLKSEALSPIGLIRGNIMTLHSSHGFVWAKAIKTGIRMAFKKELVLKTRPWTRSIR